MVHLFDLDPDSLHTHVQAWGMPAFRADQILKWVYQQNVSDIGQMSNLSGKDRETLSENLVITTGRVDAHQVASDGTQKLLVAWPGLDSRTRDTQSQQETMSLPMLEAHEVAPQSECVMIPSDSRSSGRSRKTACISSQVGCPVGCKFCASGLGGLESHLTAGRIVEQVWQLTQLPQVERISNVVFMGMGEPLSNFSQVSQALRTLTADWGMGISARRITVSTVGVPSGIRRLAELDIPVTLAISLHAPNDEIRQSIIPWAEFVTMEQLLDAGHEYFRKTGREITLEYILLGQVNDQREHAKELAKVAKTLRANVNLIRYNEVAGLRFDRPHTEDVLTFRKTLAAAGINVHIRASRGRDIAAACGQLRHEKKQVG